jgi:hypothetical protein
MTSIIPSDVGVVVHNVGDRLAWTLGCNRFLDWLRNGVAMFTMADATESDPEFHFQLPAKYERLASADARFLSLIDEVECISLRTADLTDEWRIRLQNQGEQWLPFRFRREWFEEVKQDRAGRQEPTGQHPLDADTLPPQDHPFAIPITVNSVAGTLPTEALDAPPNSRGGKAKTTSPARSKGSARSGTRISRVADQPALSEQVEEPRTGTTNPEDGDETVANR